MAAEQECVDVFDAEVGFYGDEGFELCNVEVVGLADDLIRWEAGGLSYRVDYRVERVTDDDYDGVGCVLLDVFADGLDDLDVGADEVVARYIGLVGDVCGDDDDV